MSAKINPDEYLTFDDVLLVPKYSKILPAEVDLRARLTNKIRLNIPIVSAPMDTVTGDGLAIAMAQQGGIGIIHRNCTIAAQAEMVRKAKKSSSLVIKDPVTLSPSQNIRETIEIMENSNISGLPVVENGALVGIVTSRDLRFKTDMDVLIKNVMTKKVITIDESKDMSDAIEIFDREKIEKLPVINKKGKLVGLITAKDIRKSKEFPNASKGKDGRFIIGAATGPLDIERIEALVNAEADVLVIDTAHGHSKNVLDAVKRIKKEYGIQIIAGNVATSDATTDLISAGVDGVRVGVGPGAICTTRVIAGVGVPQLSAIKICSEAADKYKVPIIADGGIKNSGDMAKAIAAGASTVMVGSLLAGTEESLGRTVYVGGRKYKSYRGMGSLGAMKAGSDRYAKTAEGGKFVPEGIEGIVPYRGTVKEIIFQLLGGIKSSMGYCGCKNIAEMRKGNKFVKITAAGLKESHPHDIRITEEAPNYFMNN